MNDVNIIYLESVGSTSDYLKERPELWDRVTAVVARNQTKGRGRLARQWSSGPGLDLAFSYVIRPAVGVTGMSAFSVVSGIALYRAMKKYCGSGLALKWPNDLFFGDKKLAGILCELVISDSPGVIIGIGVNVNSRAFPPEIASCATSLALINGRDYDPAALMREILDLQLDLFRDYSLPLSAALIEEWNAASIDPGRAVRYQQEARRRGVVLGIDSQGRLVVSDDETGENILFDDDARLFFADQHSGIE